MKAVLVALYLIIGIASGIVLTIKLFDHGEDHIESACVGMLIMLIWPVALAFFALGYLFMMTAKGYAMFIEWLRERIR